MNVQAQAKLQNDADERHAGYVLLYRVLLFVVFFNLLFHSLTLKTLPIILIESIIILFLPPQLWSAKY